MLCVVMMSVVMMNVVMLNVGIWNIIIFSVIKLLNVIMQCRYAGCCGAIYARCIY